jgi:hypothetical protein
MGDEVGWGGSHDPEHDLIVASRKMATAVREYLASETAQHRANLVETLAAYDRAVERTRLRSVPR